jgi:hypothetical protein
MKAVSIYKSLASEDTNYVGQTRSKRKVLKEVDLGKTGIFVFEVVSMVSFPVKSYGKLKRRYDVEVWELDADGEPVLVSELSFVKKSDALKNFNSTKLY